MPRRIQRKPFKQVREKVTSEQSATRGVNIQGVITIVGGLTGIIVAILWVAGRFYAAGYFSAMNIPAYQINFSVWEYAEASWLKLIFYFLKRIYPIVLLLAIVPLTTFILAIILQRIFPRLRLTDVVSKIVSGLSRIRSAVSYTAALSIIIIFSYVLLEAFIEINRSGQVEGKEVVFSSSYTVQVYSRDYLPLGLPKVVSNTTSSLMEYSGLRLLTFNNGKYYLFRDIDPNTCKPSQVFVVPDAPNIVLVLSAIAPIDTPCTTTATAQ